MNSYDIFKKEKDEAHALVQGVRFEPTESWQCLPQIFFCCNKEAYTDGISLDRALVSDPGIATV